MTWYQDQLNEMEHDTLELNLGDLGNPWPRMAAVESMMLAALIRIERLEKAAKP